MMTRELSHRDRRKIQKQGVEKLNQATAAMAASLEHLDRSGSALSEDVRKLWNELRTLRARLEHETLG